jgi:hypothetical protein
MVAPVDPKSQLLLWQGDAQGVVSADGKPSQGIQAAVQKMFAKFPS